MGVAGSKVSKVEAQAEPLPLPPPRCQIALPGEAPAPLLAPLKRPRNSGNVEDSSKPRRKKRKLFGSEEVQESGSNAGFSTRMTAGASEALGPRKMEPMSTDKQAETKPGADNPLVILADGDVSGLTNGDCAEVLDCQEHIEPSLRPSAEHENLTSDVAIRGQRQSQAPTSGSPPSAYYLAGDSLEHDLPGSVGLDDDAPLTPTALPQELSIPETPESCRPQDIEEVPGCQVAPDAPISQSQREENRRQIHQAIVALSSSPLADLGGGDHLNQRTKRPDPSGQAYPGLAPDATPKKGPGPKKTGKRKQPEREAGSPSPSNEDQQKSKKRRKRDGPWKGWSGMFKEDFN